jgi:hypothetical protein
MGASQVSAKTDSDAMRRVAERAQGLLVRRAILPGNSTSLNDRLAAAGINNDAALAALIYGDRHAARDKLGVRTLGETDRIISALDRARKELKGEATSSVA